MLIFNLDLDGLSYYTTKMKQYIEDKIVNKVDKVSGKGLSTNDLTDTLKNNYDAAYTHSQNAHAPSNAQANQNAFSNITVGSTTIAADTTTDTLTLSGSNVTITPDATNDKVTIGITKANVTAALGYTPPSTNTTYEVATSSALGLVKSGADITVDSDGNVSVNDDSHNHIISNVDGLQAALDGKAASIHGTHVPTPQTANNAIFLRNDNTWQTVTPANIGAAKSDHTHSIVQSAIEWVDSSGNLINTGSETIPVFINGGVAEACTSLSLDTTGSAAKLNNTTAIGSATKPVYFNASGVPVAGTYTLGAACAKGVADSTSASALSTGSNLVTERDVYYGTPKINGAKTYNSNTSIYAPTSVGTSGQVLKSSGNGAPVWGSVDVTGITQMDTVTINSGTSVALETGSGSNSDITANGSPIMTSANFVLDGTTLNITTN